MDAGSWAARNSLARSRTACSVQPAPSPANPAVIAGASSAQRAAGYVDHLAGDEPGALAGQERDDVRDVRGLSHPLDGDLGRGGLLEVLEAHADPGSGRGRHVGGDEAGRDRVRGDPELAELDR